MKSFKKSILALGLALGVMASMGASAFAASGQINGYYTSGNSSVSSTSGSAYTSFGDYGSVAVNSTYSYVNTNNLTTGTQSKNNGHYKSASVSFSAPKNCRSVKVVSSHSISAYSQTWSANTSATY